MQRDARFGRSAGGERSRDARLMQGLDGGHLSARLDLAGCWGVALGGLAGVMKSAGDCFAGAIR